MQEYQIQFFRTMRSDYDYNEKFTYGLQDAMRIAYQYVPLSGCQRIYTNPHGPGQPIYLKGTVFCHEGDKVYRIWESQSGKTYRYLKKDGSLGKYVKELM